MSSVHHDVTVIGAGWSGLVACKSMLESNLSVITLEKRDGIGGIWNYSDDPNTPSVMQSTCATSSSTVTEYSDFPMPKEIGMFPHHVDILEYLKSYANHFNLMSNIRFNTQVTEVEKKGDIWHVGCSNGNVYTSRYIVIASGLNGRPNRELEDDVLKQFEGKIFHACEIKTTLEEYKDKRLLVLGGGETASDICMEWFDHAKFIYWSIPRGQHFFRKYAKILPWTKPQALDKASSQVRSLLHPSIKGKPGVAWLCKWITNGSLLAYQGHGIHEWKNSSNTHHFVFNKSGEVLDLVDRKRLVPKGGVVKCKGKEITFVDRSKEEFDIVIQSMGYKTDVSYLPEKFASMDLRQRYKFIFDAEDPSVALVGFVRPMVGSLTTIAEMQARLAAFVFSGKVTLPPLKERKEIVEKDFNFWSGHFRNSSQRIEGLVEAFTYLHDIARLAQVYPNYWSLFKSNPRYWYTAFFSPYNASMFRLNEPEYVEKAIETMRRHNKASLFPWHFFLTLFLRLILFDWFVNRISDIKYQIQISRWWPTVRSWRVIKVLNSIWTFPKRCLFDNKTDFRLAESRLYTHCTFDTLKLKTGEQ